MHPEIKTEIVTRCICGCEDARPLLELKDYEYFTSVQSFAFVRCERCGLVRLSPRPLVSEFGKIYPREYSPFHFDKGDSIGYKARRIRDRLMVRGYLKGLPDSAKILDVGCGDGALVRSMRLFGPARFELAACDINSAFVDNLRGLAIDTYPGDFLELDLPRAHYDMILCSHTLEHVPDPTAFVKRMAELLAPGGQIVIQVPSPTGLNWWLHRSRYWSGYHVPRHFWLFRRAHLDILSDQVGLQVKWRRALPAPGFWMQSLFVALRRTGLARLAPLLDVNRRPTPLPALAGLVFFTLLDFLQIFVFRASDILEVSLTHRR